MNIDMDEDDQYVPEKDLTDVQEAMSAVGEAENVFNHQRAVVAKLTRAEIEDRYLRTLEENVALKKHACKQEDKIKKLATKLIRVLSEKKRLEMANGGTPSKQRDIETEEIIEDQQQKIKDLEKQVTTLKEKLFVAKQQLIGSSGANAKAPKKTATSSTTSRASYHRSPVPSASLNVSGVVPTGPLLSQQAQRLLEEARNENRMLEESLNVMKEQINIFEQEIEQLREQHKIKESNYEEEIQVLKAQVLDAQRHTASENIQLIHLHKESNVKSAQLQSLKSEVEGLGEQVAKLKADLEDAQRDAKEVAAQFQEEQQRSISLSKQLSENVSSKHLLAELEAKSNALEKENVILRESNNKLLDSAYNLERERHFQATENSLKVQIAQLESTLKSDLEDKSALQDALSKERERTAKLEAEIQDLQGKYFTAKESVEDQEERLSFFAKKNDIDMKELEEALVILRHKQDSNKSIPHFLDEVDSEGKSVKADLAELQAQYVDTINELEKTRSILRVQRNINDEQKKEIDALQKRLQQVKDEYMGQIGEYKKLLDIRANRIHKLEVQLRDTAYGNLQKNIEKSGVESGLMLGKGTSVHTSSGQSLFEIHIQRVNLIEETLNTLGNKNPRLFVTWTFYENDMQYTPMASGPSATFDSSSYYKVRLDDSFLDYLTSAEVEIDLHMVVGQECKEIGYSLVKMSEVIEYPSNKLHSSHMILWNHGDQKDKILGTIDLWFKLHTSDAKRIHEWLEHRREVEQMLQNSHNTQKVFTKAELLAGEEKQMNKDERRKEKGNHEKDFLSERVPSNMLPPPKQAMKSRDSKSTDHSHSEFDDGMANNLTIAKEINDAPVEREVNKSKEKDKVMSRPKPAERKIQPGYLNSPNPIERKRDPKRSIPNTQLADVEKNDKKEESSAEEPRHEDPRPVPRKRGVLLQHLKKGKLSTSSETSSSSSSTSTTSHSSGSEDESHTPIQASKEPMKVSVPKITETQPSFNQNQHEISESDDTDQDNANQGLANQERNESKDIEESFLDTNRLENDVKNSNILPTAKQSSNAKHVKSSSETRSKTQKRKDSSLSKSGNEEKARKTFKDKEQTDLLSELDPAKQCSNIKGVKSPTETRSKPQNQKNDKDSSSKQEVEAEGRKKSVDDEKTDLLSKLDQGETTDDEVEDEKSDKKEKKKKKKTSILRTKSLKLRRKSGEGQSLDEIGEKQRKGILSKPKSKSQSDVSKDPEHEDSKAKGKKRGFLQRLGSRFGKSHEAIKEAVDDENFAEEQENTKDEEKPKTEGKDSSEPQKQQVSKKEKDNGKKLSQKLKEKLFHKSSSNLDRENEEENGKEKESNVEGDNHSRNSKSEEEGKEEKSVESEDSGDVEESGDEEESDDDESEGEEESDDEYQSSDDDVVETVSQARSSVNAKLSKPKKYGSSTGAESISNDSEGLVVSKLSSNRSRLDELSQMAPGQDAIVIIVSGFRCADSRAKFLKDTSVKKIYVEFKFLDLAVEETETPISLPKPRRVGESIIFNFRKVIPINVERKRLLSKMLAKSRPLIFSVISEPSEDTDACKELGRAELDFRSIKDSGFDLKDCPLDVVSSYDDGTVIGVLTISVMASDVLKSIQSL